MVKRLHLKAEMPNMKTEENSSKAKNNIIE